MKVRIAKVSGFCWGVERILKIAEEEKKKKPFDTLGPLIHNPIVIKSLEEKGMRPVKSLDQTAKKRILIRAHGVPPEIYEEAKRKGIEIIDGTCPYVRKVQKLAEKLVRDGYQVVVIGKKDHPEVVAVVGYTNGQAAVISTPDEAEGFEPSKKRIGIVVQTTFRYDIFSECVKELLKKAAEVKIFNTRCSDTDRRQKEAIDLSSKVDVMIVVGGRSSSNTMKLLELSEAKGRKAYIVESPEELRKEWFEGVKEVGVIGGASTPIEVVREVVKKVEKFDC